MKAVGAGEGAKIGVMGGTFDPVHLGHLAAAQEAACRLGLERVIFIPAGFPPHKPSATVTPAHHRWEMVTLAIADNPLFFASRLEIARPGPSYTVETIAALREARPGCEWFFITGADAVLELPTWREPERLVSLCTVVAVTRPLTQIDPREALPPGLAAAVRVLPVPGVAVSATELRERVRQGLPIRYLTADPVIGYIYKEGLYL